jgi:hypothetical protein
MSEIREEKVKVRFGDVPQIWEEIIITIWVASKTQPIFKVPVTYTVKVWRKGRPLERATGDLMAKKRLWHLYHRALCHTTYGGLTFLDIRSWKRRMINWSQIAEISECESSINRKSAIWSRNQVIDHSIGTAFSEWSFKNRKAFQFFHSVMAYLSHDFGWKE